MKPTTKALVFLVGTALLLSFFGYLIFCGMLPFISEDLRNTRCNNNSTNNELLKKINVNDDSHVMFYLNGLWLTMYPSVIMYSIIHDYDSDFCEENSNFVLKNILNIIFLLFVMSVCTIIGSIPLNEILKCTTQPNSMNHFFSLFFARLLNPLYIIQAFFVLHFLKNNIEMKEESEGEDGDKKRANKIFIIIIAWVALFVGKICAMEYKNVMAIMVSDLTLCMFEISTLIFGLFNYFSAKTDRIIESTYVLKIFIMMETYHCLTYVLAKYVWKEKDEKMIMLFAYPIIDIIFWTIMYFLYRLIKRILFLENCCISL
jgi:hypothetical protein